MEKESSAGEPSQQQGQSRTPEKKLIFKLDIEVLRLFRDWFKKKNFIELHPPKIISDPANERGANVFEEKLSHRNGSAYVVLSPLLYKQKAIAADFQRVYTVGPVFSIEGTHRHLREFVSLDFEMAFNYHYHEVVDVIGEMFVEIFKGLRDNFADEIATVNRKYPAAPFEFLESSLRLEYREAIDMLREDGVEIGDEEDLSTPIEKRLGRLVKAKYSTDFYILDKYPLAGRPFYTMPCPINLKYSNFYVMFMRGEKILSGGHRIHSADYLETRANSLGMDIERVKSYIDVFRYACRPHAGGEIVLEKMLTLYLGLDNIHETLNVPA